MKWLEAMSLSRSATGPTIKVTVLSSLETHTFETYLAAYAAQGGRRLEITSSSFGELRITLQAAVSQEFPRHPIVLVLDWEDFVPGLSYRSARREILDDAKLWPEAEETLQLIKILAGAVKSRLVVVPPQMTVGPLSAMPRALAGRLDAVCYGVWAELARLPENNPQVEVIRPGTAGLADEISDVHHLYRFGWPYTTEATDILASLTWVNIQGRHAARKILITDLDNTLWSGIVGEDGPENVSWESEEGTFRHLLYQRFLNQIASEGILIAVCSKNDPEIAERALMRGDLILRPGSIVASRIGWQSKSEMVREILATVNLSADATVFVDDTAFEIDEVTSGVPGVIGLQFPDRNSDVAEFFSSLRGHFENARLTDEDRGRVHSYAATLEIAANQSRVGDLDAYLASLNMVATVSLVSDPALERPLQLLNKTNQFHLHGTRITAEQWASYFHSPFTVIEVSLKDRLCQYGSVLAAVVEPLGEDLRIRHLAMSCRVFARGLEFALLDWLKRHASKAGCHQIIFDYQDSGRNKAVSEFLEKFAAVRVGLLPACAVHETAGAVVFHGEIIDRSFGEQPDAALMGED